MTPQELRSELELDRLATELGTTSTALSGLGDLPPDDLAHLRHQVADGLVAKQRQVFDAFARAAGLVPATLAARITGRVIGPALAGRIAGSLSGDRAAAIMSHLDTAFLADSCTTLSASAAARLVTAVDDDRLVATATELARRDDHATLGRFVDVLDDRRLALVLEALLDPRDLLLTGATVDSGAVLDRVVRVLPQDRRAAVLLATPDHPRAAATVLVVAGAPSRGLLLDALSDLDDDAIVAFLDRLTAAVRTSRVLRAAAASLPGHDLATASSRLDRSDEVRRAIGRLVVATVEEEHR